MPDTLDREQVENLRSCAPMEAPYIHKLCDTALALMDENAAYEQERVALLAAIRQLHSAGKRCTESLFMVLPEGESDHWKAYRNWYDTENKIADTIAEAYPKKTMRGDTASAS